MINDVLFMIIGGLIGTGSASVTLGLARRRRPAAPDLRALCSCGHGYGVHATTERDGVRTGCGAQIRITLRGPITAAFDGTDRYEHRQCPCVHYDGPDPDHLRLLRGA